MHLRIGLTGFVFALVVAVFAPATAKAGFLVEEAPIGSVGTPTTVSVSSSTWTKVPTSSSLNQRSGIIISVPSTNTANIVAHIGGCSSTSIATTVRPMEVAKGSGFVLVPIDNNTCLWTLTLNTSAENIHVQEIRQ